MKDQQRSRLIRKRQSEPGKIREYLADGAPPSLAIRSRIAVIKAGSERVDRYTMLRCHQTAQDLRLKFAEKVGAACPLIVDNDFARPLTQ
jgi:hypothetical protein